MFDQVTLFMIFMMLCFAGMAAMFYFILRGLDELTRELRGERTQLIGIMQSVESSVELLVKAAQLSLKHQAGRAAAASPDAAQNKQTVTFAAGESPLQKTAEIRPDDGFAPLSISGSASATANPRNDPFLEFGKNR